MLPRIEAYWELLHRRVEAPWSEDRAYNLMFLVTEDQLKSERFANAVQRAMTPLPKD